MNFNKNEKINQVSENTLVIGIDDQGRMLPKSFPIVQSHIGYFCERLMALKTAHEKQDILVGFDPTDH